MTDSKRAIQVGVTLKSILDRFALQRIADLIDLRKPKKNLVLAF